MSFLASFISVIFQTHLGAKLKFYKKSYIQPAHMRHVANALNYSNKKLQLQPCTQLQDKPGQAWASVGKPVQVTMTM